MEFWEQWLAAITASGLGLGAVVMGLSAWLGNVWSKRIETATTLRNDLEKLKEQSVVDKQARYDQAQLDERMKEIEQKYNELNTKGEYFHQISQQTYQKLFERKMVAYEKFLLKSYKLQEDIENYELFITNREKITNENSLNPRILELSKIIFNDFNELTIDLNIDLIILSPELQQLVIKVENIFFEALDDGNYIRTAPIDFSNLINNPTDTEIIKKYFAYYLADKKLQDVKDIIKQIRKDVVKISNKIDTIS